VAAAVIPTSSRSQQVVRSSDSPKQSQMQQQQKSIANILEGSDVSTTVTSSLFEERYVCQLCGVSLES
jgi:hypothetical protein